MPVNTPPPPSSSQPPLPTQTTPRPRSRPPNTRRPPHPLPVNAPPKRARTRAALRSALAGRHPYAPGPRHASLPPMPDANGNIDANADANVDADGDDHVVANMRSVTDLLGGVAPSRAESLLGHSAPADAWSSLVDTMHNLPSAPLPSTTHPAPQASPESPDAMTPLPNRRLPADYSLKTRVAIASQNTLHWMRLLPPHVEHAALCDVLNGSDAGDRGAVGNGGGVAGVPKGRRPSPLSHTVPHPHVAFARSLISFRFPAAPPSTSLAANWHTLFTNPSALTATASPTAAAAVGARAVATASALRGGSGGGGGPGVLARLRREALARVAMFQVAWRSLYFAFRRGEVATLYVLLPYAAIVFARDVKEGAAAASCTPYATVSPATPGVRSLLSDYVVPFTVCCRGVGGGGEGEGGGDGGVGGKVEGERVEVKHDEVAVVVEGDFAVHALYNFIMCAAHKLSGAADVPTLVSDMPFHFATAMTAAVSAVRRARVDVEEDGDENGMGDEGREGQWRYTASVEGVLTPRQVEELCLVLDTTQRKDFTAVLDVERRTLGVNVIAGRVGVGDGGKDGGGKNRNAIILGEKEVLSRVAAFRDREGLFAAMATAEVRAEGGVG